MGFHEGTRRSSGLDMALSLFLRADDMDNLYMGVWFLS